MVRPYQTIALVLFCTLSTVRSARADCDGNWVSSVGGVYPPDGQQDVPTNAKIFAFPPDVEVTIDGEVLEEAGYGVWDPGPLEPGSTHLLEVKMLTYSDTVHDSVTSSFTVGDTAAPFATAENLEISSLEVWSEEELSTSTDTSWTECVQPRDGCYDTCHAAVAAFKVPPGDAVAWRASSPLDEVVAYRECGGFVPVPFCDHDRSGETCFELEAIGPHGEVIAAASHCFDYPCDYGGLACSPAEGETVPSEPPATPQTPRSLSCAAEGGRSFSLPALAIIFLVAAWRRRASRFR